MIEPGLNPKPARISVAWSAMQCLGEQGTSSARVHRVSRSSKRSSDVASIFGAALCVSPKFVATHVSIHYYPLAQRQLEADSTISILY
jgi:hypothetical protein